MTLDKLPKAAAELPEEAQALFEETYNDDFGWRCSEAHAEKAAWRAVWSQWKKDGENWVRK